MAGTERLGRFLGRRSTLSVVDQIIVSATNFTSGVVVGRTSSKEMFGIYMLGFSIFTLACDLQFSLIATPYTIHSPRLDGRDLAEYTGSSLIHQLVVSVLFVLVLGIVLVADVNGLGPRGVSSVIVAIMAAIWFVMLREFVRRICFARMLLGSVLVLDLAVGCMQVGALLVLAKLGRVSASAGLWVIGGACFIAVVSAFLSSRSGYRMVRARAVPDFLVSWSLGKWVLASGVLWTASMNLYPWLLALFHGTGAAGTWAACSGVVALANPVLVGAQNYLGPRIAGVFARDGAGELRRFIGRTTWGLIGATSLFLVLLVFEGEHMAVLLYGRNYLGTGPVISLLGLNLVAVTAGFTSSRSLFAIPRADIDFAVNVVAMIMLLFAGISMVRWWGTFGAAIGILLSSTLAAAIRWTWATRLLTELASSASGNGA
jgi:O-antigen/teichoic acid export membrane protein